MLILLVWARADAREKGFGFGMRMDGSCVAQGVGCLRRKRADDDAMEARGGG